jgi:hypothetical protein
VLTFLGWHGQAQTLAVFLSRGNLSSAVFSFTDVLAAQDA